MRHLDDDILFEILVRLPAKSLLRFRCVDKRWLSLISDPAFAKAHLRMSMQQPTPPQRLLVKKDHRTRLISVNIEQVINGRPDPVYLDLPSCFREDGAREPFFKVGCCSCHGLVYVLGCEDRRFFHNPTTREWRRLPEHPPLGNIHEQWIGDCGFGYDAMHDDYKVLTSSRLECGSAYTFYVFSLKSNSWRSIGVFNYDCPNLCGATYVNGFLHWTGYYPSRIISFNLATEQFCDDMLPLPNFKTEHGTIELSAIKAEGHGGSLIAYRNCYRVPGTSEAWIMKDCCGPDAAWTKLWCFRNKQLALHSFQLIEDGKIVPCEVEGGKRPRLSIYNPREDSWNNFRVPFIKSRYFPDMIVYVESLVSLRVN